MYVFWKPLILLGLLFWVVLFSTDILRRKVFDHHISEPSQLLPSLKKTTVEPKKSSSLLFLQSSPSEELNTDFGLTMILVNFVIFIVSIVFCSITKFIATIICKYLKRTPSDALKLTPIETVPIGDILKENGPQDIVKVLKISSSSNTEMRPISDQTCQTVYNASISLKYDQTLKLEYSKLKQELLMVQTNSIKEHALLSRKLDAVSKEKKDLNKRLNTSLKEINAAKTQIEELTEEKKILEKRLDNVTKEARLNVKTKKMALAKLEEISASVDDLKRQLEQVTRDKEILQGKLKVLRSEYEKLQERLRLLQEKEENRTNADNTTSREVAEKDESVYEITNNKLMEDQSMEESSQSSINQIISNESVFLPYVISQTEIDMKNIQTKILQLEKSIEGFETKTNVLDELTRLDGNIEHNILESINQSSQEAEKLDDRLGSVLARLKATRENISCKNTYDNDKVEILRNTLKEKIRILENIKEKGDECLPNNCPSEATSVTEEEYEMSSDEASPRFLSNSQAFQQFLQNAGAETTLINMEDEKFDVDS